MYTDDKTTQVVLAMLKAYGIKNIVVSPGTRNCGFAASVQSDPFFNVYSVVDERSAAYFATGLAFETDGPVVITCTGATASRNYLSALTEAFYRRLPVIALTFAHDSGNAYSLTQQHLDRSVSQNDVKLVSHSLPKVVDEKSKQTVELILNAAFIKCMYGRRGPVHIDVMYLGTKFNVPTLPEVTRAEYVSVYDLMDKKKRTAIMEELEGKKVGVFIGSHPKMSEALTAAISAFAEKYHAPVFVDHTSNYHGNNKVLIGQICDVMLTDNRPDVMIDLGSICGQYSLSRLYTNTPVWRVSDAGELQQRAGRTVRYFDCAEEFFFKQNAKAGENLVPVNYYEEIVAELEGMKLGELPFSGVFVAKHYSQKLPAGCVLHTSILNSLRSVNFFKFDESIDIICNVGGFGIDGPVSTLLGQSVSNRDRLYFGQIGDLAFFYDMNALGNRHVGGNLRILLVNNNLGVEFRVNTWLTRELGKDGIEPFIAARGHNGSAREWVQSCGFHYMSASSKEEFLEKLDEFCHPDLKHFDRPVVFEVFTSGDDEVDAVQVMRGKPKTIFGIRKGRCSFGVRLAACFIRDKQKRREFREKHSK